MIAEFVGWTGRCHAIREGRRCHQAAEVCLGRADRMCIVSQGQ